MERQIIDQSELDAITKELDEIGLSGESPAKCVHALIQTLYQYELNRVALIKKLKGALKDNA